jgi:alkaline phosphatase D
VLLLVVLVPASWAADDLLVATGDVTSTSAVLWVRGAAGGTVAVEYGPLEQAPAGRVTLRPAKESDFTARARIEGLRPSTAYAWRARSGEASATGRFVTAPAADDPRPVRLLWSGDLGSARNCRRRDGGYRIFDAMAQRHADFFLFVGDTIYADHTCRGPEFVPGSDFEATTLEGYHAKHRYNRQDPSYAAFLRGTSVSAIWDDHEVRNDFAGPVEPLMPVGRRAFLDYWPVQPPDEDTARLYRTFRWGRLLQVFILDTRQYRSANTDPDGPGKTMLGGAQRRWLIDGVTASTATWKVVVSSVTLSVPTGRGARDSWSNATVWGVPEENGTGFAVERDAILRSFRDRGVRNLVVLAADVHHPELVRHHPWPDFSFHEFIAGPLSASLGRPRPLDAGLNPRSLFAAAGVRNFGELVIEPALLTVRLVDEDGAVLFTHTIGPE